MPVNVTRTPAAQQSLNVEPAAAPVNGAALSPMIGGRTLAIAVSALNSLHARYAILLPDGRTVGDLHIAPDKPAKYRRRRLFERGALQSLYAEPMRTLEPGGVVVIPLAGVNLPHADGADLPRALRSAMAAYACNRWGTGSCVTNYNADAQTVELLRVK